MDYSNKVASADILADMFDQITNVISLSNKTCGLGFVVAQSPDMLEHAFVREGLGEGIQALSLHIEELAGEIDAGVRELRRRAEMGLPRSQPVGCVQ